MLRTAALALFCCACSAPARVEVGREVPAYAAVTINGDSVSLAGARGRVVLLNVWATWCKPCRAEIPELQAMHEQYAARGLDIIGVSVDMDGADDDIRQFMQEYEMTYPVWRDPEERIMAQYLVLGVPSTYLIDRDGKLLWKKTGQVERGDTALIRMVEQALHGQ